ncbi:MAG: hypothetical protein DRR42_02650, partial [Gammaproteobacteria bacterium]
GGAARTQGGRGNNGCRVGESILVTGMSQNLSRGSDTPYVEFYDGDPAVPFAFEEARFIAARANSMQL